MNTTIPRDWKYLRGDAYSVKEELKALGARWDRDTGCWWVAPERYREAQALVDDAKGRR